MSRRRRPPPPPAGTAALAAALVLALAIVGHASASGPIVFDDGVCVVRVNPGTCTGVVIRGDPAQCSSGLTAEGKRARSQGLPSLPSPAASAAARGRPVNDTLTFDLPPGGGDSGGRLSAAAAPTFTVTPEGDGSSPDGTWYTVAWSGISGVRTSDRIAVLIGRQPQADPTLEAAPALLLFRDRGVARHVAAGLRQCAHLLAAAARDGDGRLHPSRLHAQRQPLVVSS